MCSCKEDRTTRCGHITSYIFYVFHHAHTWEKNCAHPTWDRERKKYNVHSSRITKNNNKTEKQERLGNLNALSMQWQQGIWEEEKEAGPQKIKNKLTTWTLFLLHQNTHTVTRTNACTHSYTHTHTLQWHVKSMTHDGMTGAERLREHKMACNRPSSTRLVDTMTAHKVIPRQKTDARRNTRGEKKMSETTLAKVAHDIQLHLYRKSIEDNETPQERQNLYSNFGKARQRTATCHRFLNTSLACTAEFFKHHSCAKRLWKSDYALWSSLFKVFFMLPVDENHLTLCAVLTSISGRSLVGLHKADKTIRGPPNFKLTSTFLFKHGYHP